MNDYLYESKMSKADHNKVTKEISEVLPTSHIAKIYLDAGLNFAHSYQRFVEGKNQLLDTAELLDEWCFWENKYVMRKFQPLSLTDFLDSDIYGKSLKRILETRLKRGETPLLHACEYRNLLYNNNASI